MQMKLAKHPNKAPEKKKKINLLKVETKDL